MNSIDKIMKEADYAYTKKDNLEKTLELTYKAIEINSEDIRPWDLMGVVLFEIGENEEALKCFEKILEIDPKNTEAKLKKGQLLNEIKKYDEAIKIFDELINNNTIHKEEAIIAKLTLYLEIENEAEFQNTLKICNEIIEKENSKYLKSEIEFILSVHKTMNDIKLKKEKF